MTEEHLIEDAINYINKYKTTQIKDLRLLDKAVFSLMSVIAIHDKQNTFEN